MPMNNGMNGGMNGGMQPGSTWKCKCGAENTGKFCEFCGELRPY